MWGVVAALLVLVGAMALTFRLLGQVHGVRGGRRRGAMQVLDRVATGPRQGVVLLQVQERVLIVGVGETHTLLGEVEGEARDALLLPAPTTPTRAGWRTLLPGRLALLLLVLLAPVTLSAQTITAPPPNVTARQVSPVPGPVAPQVASPGLPQIDVRVGQGSDELRLSGAVGIVVFMGALTLLPALFMLMTGFTRILIVLGFLRSAMGTQTAPPTQLLVAIAVILTGMVMQPVFSEANQTALQPYLRGEIGQVEAYQAALVPMRGFMLANTRERELATFVELGGHADLATVDEIPVMTLMAAFVTSELRTAFQMGFVLFLPFLIIDLIVASVLMSMGMFMLPPVMVSLPFKLLLFVLADGWALVMRQLAASFQFGG